MDAELFLLSSEEVVYDIFTFKYEGEPTNPRFYNGKNFWRRKNLIFFSAIYLPGKNICMRGHIFVDPCT